MLFGMNKIKYGGAGLKIVIADDEADIRTYLEKILSGEGHTVISAADGQEALKKVDAELPDLVILDIRMPKLNGMDTLQKIKENPATADLPVMIVSVLSEDKDIMSGYIHGADYYITKPFTRETLLSGIKFLRHSISKKRAHHNIGPSLA